MTDSTQAQFGRIPSAPVFAGRLVGLRESDVKVLVVLAVHTNHLGRCMVGVRRLAELTGYMVGTVSDAIKRLETAGMIVVERRGNGRANVYKLADDSCEGADSRSAPAERLGSQTVQRPPNGGDGEAFSAHWGNRSAHTGQTVQRPPNVTDRTERTAASRPAQPNPNTDANPIPDSESVVAAAGEKSLTEAEPRPPVDTDSLPGGIPPAVWTAMEAAGLSSNARTRGIATRCARVWGDRAPVCIREIAAHQRGLGKGSGAVVEELDARSLATEHSRAKPTAKPTKAEECIHAASQAQREQIAAEGSAEIDTVKSAGWRAVRQAARRAIDSSSNVLPWVKRRRPRALRASAPYRAAVLRELESSSATISAKPMSSPKPRQTATPQDDIHQVDDVTSHPIAECV